jgi:4'-phosphopantetheinyl transferase
MPELAQEDFDSILPLVSSERQERIKKFHFFRDARNCLLGDVLSRFEICRATGNSNRKLEFSVNTYGKPFLIDNHHVQFNISHAGHYVSCAISDEPVGVDVELIKTVDLKTAERFFAPDEIAYIMIHLTKVCN